MKMSPSDTSRRSRRQSAIAAALALSMLHGQVVAAALSLPNVPVFLGTVVPPNLMFVLDDSGSMFWTHLPDAAANFSSTSSYRFSRSDGTVTTDTFNDYGAYATTIGPNGSSRYGLFSAHCNGAYFNPNTTYTPPPDANGVQLPDASYTSAWFDGMRPGLGTLNLSNNLRIRNGFTGGFYYQYTGAQPDLNFQYVSGSVQTNTFYQECVSTIGNNPGAGVFQFVDVNSASAAVKTNYANWFSYYRTRMQAMKSAAGRAFAGVNDSFRVGFMTINTSNNASLLNIAPFTTANKTAWYNRFYSINQRDSSTPLRTALDRAGQLYQNASMSGITGETDPVTHECQKNFTLLSTDGKWNDSHSATGNRDRTVPVLPVAVTGLNAGSNWPFPILEGTTAVSNTLADIALRYWATDLRTGMPNNVPSDPADPASWQHMTTFTLGFGVKGTLDYPGALPGLTAGTTRWPSPVSNADTTVDDLWHAGINGFGGYLSAQDPTELVTSLQNMLNDLASRVTSSSSVAANTTQLNTGARIYRARFDSSDWSGQLQSFKLDAIGAIAASYEWDAGNKLAMQAGSNSDSRAIITWNGGGAPFQWNSLSAAQQTDLRTPPGGGAADAISVGQQRLQFLRGWSANEGTGATQFRVRAGKLLGDIIDSSPVFVGSPQAGYSDVLQPGYLAFRQANAGRKPVIYVGANDGMLHGFDASSIFNVSGVSIPTGTSGDEVLAYVPGRVFHKLSKLTSQTYRNAHQFYVNSTPMVGDADLSNGAGTDWRTVLVGGLAHGGQAFFALDVTNPNAFSEANAGSLALWEFTDADDADLGYTFNQPAIDPLRNVAAQIVRMNNGQWAAIVGNGYNNTEADGHASATGHAVLYILFLNGPTGGTWTQGTDYIKLDTGSGTLASPNGLSTPRPLDENGDGKVDSIYAGDLNGNMWKFDVTGGSPAAWSVGNSGQPVFTAVRGGVPQPITSTPVVLKHPLGGNFITFGTGKFLETADAAGPFTTQSLYGVRDNPPGGTVALGSLVEQTVLDTVQGTQPDPNNPGQFITSGIVFRTGSSNPVDYTSGDKGWYMDLPATGETVPFNPLPTSGQVLYNTVIPSTNPCEFGGESFIMALDPFTGAASALGNFDADNDGNFSATETVQDGSGNQTAVSAIGVRSTVGITPTPNVMRVPPGGVGSSGPQTPGMPSANYPAVYSAGSGNPGLSLLNLNGSGGNSQQLITDMMNVTGRVMWKEIVQ